MTLIPEKKHTTISAIDAALESKQNKGFRAHLGASQIGNDCLRALWYSFRWCTSADHTGRMLRLFKRGELEENQFIEYLQLAGVEVWNINPDTGEQYTYSHTGGHFGGSVDGVGKGIIEAPKTIHLLEFKTHNDKSFKELLKKGLQDAKPLHYAQVQVYMGLAKLKRAFYLAVNKNDDSLYQERIKFDKEFYQELLAKADKITYAPEPLERISEKLDWYQCKWCDHFGVCKGNKVPPVSCRTCLNSTPHPDGGWRCEAYNTEIPINNQHSGCLSHLFIPQLIPYAAVQGYTTNDAGIYESVSYVTEDGKEFTNIAHNAPKKDNHYLSDELHNLDFSLIGNDFINATRELFNAKIGNSKC